MSKGKRKISTTSGLILLVIAEAAGIVLLFLSSEILEFILQAIVFLVGMLIVWYASHPLSHYLFAKISRVRTLYFYIGRSELGTSGLSVANRISPILLTIGTKLDSAKLSTLSSNRRGWIFGSGALLGLVVLALIESIAILNFRFNLLSLILGGLLFVFTLVTELELSTKSGDISKMKRQFSKPS